jgi:hypothetical protein
VRVIASNPVVRDHQAPREECLIAEWPEGHDVPLDYWLSNLPVDTEPEQLLRLAQLRWMIGLDYKQLKGHLSLDRLAHSRAYLEPKVAGGTFGAGSLPPDVNGDVLRSQRPRSWKWSTCAAERRPGDPARTQPAASTTQRVLPGPW